MSRRTGIAIRVVLFVAFVAIGAWVVETHIDELSGAADALRRMRWAAVVAAVAAEAGSIVSFALLQARLFTMAGADIGFVSLLPITLGGNAVANTLPGGAAFATAFAFTEFRELGAPDVTSAWVVVVVAVVSGVALAGLAAAGALAAFNDAQSLDLVAGVAGALVAVTAVALLLRRHGFLLGIGQRAARLVERVRPRSRATERVERWAAQLGSIRPTRRQWVDAFVLATANWLFDCTCLVLGFLAVRSAVPWRAILLAYGAGQLAINLPVTPGGLGVVEGSLTVALVAFGGTESSTVAAVLFYRLVSFWGLLAVGWPAAGYLILRRRRTGAA